VIEQAEDDEVVPASRSAMLDGITLVQGLNGVFSASRTKVTELTGVEAAITITLACCLP
jgi:hypothetical protein